MSSLVMIARISYKKKTFVVFILCVIALTKAKKEKCLDSCLNGFCRDSNQCVCDPCWTGSKCDQLVDRHLPVFDVNEKRIHLNRHNIDTKKPIFVAKAHDLDLETTCGQTDKECICSQISYELKEQNFNQRLFRINRKSGEIYLRDTENVVNDYRYVLRISAKTVVNTTDTKGTELHLTVIIQNQLNRIRREASDGSALQTTNKEPLSRQITNFQTTFHLRTLSGEPNALVIGNTVQYRLDVSMPRTSGLDLLVEIYTKDIIDENYSPALTLYNISISNKAAGIGFLTNGAPPKPKMFLNKQINNLYDRVVLDFGTVANNGVDGNKMSIFFSVALVRKVNMTAGSKHLITIGAEYNQGSYVWVGVAQVTAEIIPITEDIKLAEVEAKGVQTIQLDSSVTFTVDALLEFRSDNVTLEVWGPSYDWEGDNLIAMGQIRVNHFGSNYQTIPNQSKHYLTKRVESQSRLSYQKAILDMGLVTNIGEKVGQPSSSVDNRLSFTFTIYAINFEENVGKRAPIDMKITIGNKTVWIQTIELKITERKVEKSSARMLASNANFYPLTGFEGSLTTLTIYTEFSEGNTFIDFTVALEVPTTRKISLLEPCSARLSKESSGLNIPYVDSKQVVPIVEGNQYVFNFGRVQLIRHSSPSKKDENVLVTEIVLKVAFHEENIEGKTLSVNAKVISGAQSMKLKTEEMKIIAENKTSFPEIMVEKVVPWDQLFVDGVMSIDIDLQLPTSAAYEGVKLDVNGNNDSGIALPEVNICRFEVTEVGQSMPCSCVDIENINKNKVFYERLNNKNTTLNDHSIVSLGDLSVLQTPSSVSERKFRLNFVASLLEGTEFQSGVNYPFFVGLTFGENLIWSTNMTFPMSSEALPDMSSDERPKLDSYLRNDSPINVGFTTEAIIRLETPPKSMTNYSIEVISLDEEVSVCGLWITHVGRNMPCLNSQTKARYELRRIGDNNKAIIYFKVVANTGPNHLVSPKDEIFANTIEFMAMIRVKETAKDKKFIQIVTKYGPNEISIERTLEIPIIRSVVKQTDLRAPKVFNFETFDGFKTVGMGSSALVVFDIELEANSQAPIHTQLIDIKGYEICSTGIIKVGANYPCFSPLDLKRKESIFDLGIVCNTFLNREDISENRLILGIAVRFDDNLKEGETVRLSGQAFVGNTTVGKTQNIDLMVNKEVKQTLTHSSEPRIAPKSVTPFVAKIREMVWISFNLTIPPKSTVRVAIEARGAVEDSRAIITLHDLRIASGGVNIACPMANSNPILKFESSIENSQNDIVSADLGYLSNFGFSHAFGNEVTGDDDITIEVLAQFSDHPMTDENSDHTIKMSAIIGNESNVETISAAKYMRVLRKHSERPSIETHIIINNSTVYDRKQAIEAMAIIRHSNESTGEPVNPSLRLFLPPYIQFGQIVSFNSRVEPIVQNNTSGATVDIVFQWILFSDVLVINFTLIVDPENQRGYGRDEIKVPTPYRMICEHFRVSVSSKFPCSRIRDFTFRAKSSECDKPLGMSSGFIKDCQISASSAVSHNYSPSLGRYNSGNYWAPANRFWSGRQYLEVDFLVKTRVTKVVVQSLRSTRKVMAYTLLASDDNKIWTNVNNISYLSYTEGSAQDRIERPQEVRYYRFVIEEASDVGRESDQYIAVRLEFYGCYSEDQTNSKCELKSNTWYSDDSERQNRHFSVDPYNNVIYFCDSTSKMNQQVCYYSNSGGSTWSKMGPSIDTIEGYEMSSGKVYAINYDRPAYLSTRDGLRWSPESFETFNQSLSNPKFQHKVVVPALHRDGLRRMNLKVGNWKALYEGLYFEENDVPKTYWNKCCNV